MVTEEQKKEVMRLMEAINYVENKQWLHELKWQSKMLYYSVKRFKSEDGYFSPIAPSYVGTVQFEGDFIICHCHMAYDEIDNFFGIVQHCFPKLFTELKQKSA